jgi:hypothetical protein
MSDAKLKNFTSISDGTTSATTDNNTTSTKRKRFGLSCDGGDGDDDDEKKGVELTDVSISEGSISNGEGVESGGNRTIGAKQIFAEEEQATGFCG